MGLGAEEGLLESRSIDELNWVRHALSLSISFFSDWMSRKLTDQSFKTFAVAFLALFSFTCGNLVVTAFCIYLDAKHYYDRPLPTF